MRPHFHLDALQRALVSVPRIPYDARRNSVHRERVTVLSVRAIQVGRAARLAIAIDNASTPSRPCTEPPAGLLTACTTHGVVFVLRTELVKY